MRSVLAEEEGFDTIFYMGEFFQVSSQRSSFTGTRLRLSSTVLWLQVITLVWMLIECIVSIYSAINAHSPAMLAFGSDSLVELLSAIIVLLQFVPRFALSEESAARAAGLLLFVLAGIVMIAAVAGLALQIQPETSLPGIAITAAALIVMPALAWLKRAESRPHNNRALAADAAQSATCAYLAAIALMGVGVNGLFNIAWFDSLAALIAVPLLVKEAKEAWAGRTCACC